MYGIPVELDGEDDDLEGEQSGDNMEGKHGVLWDFGKSPPPTHTPPHSYATFKHITFNAQVLYWSIGVHVIRKKHLIGLKI